MESINKKAKRILIIDACKSARDMLIEELGSVYSILAATSAREGIGLLAEEIAIVILDLALPDGDSMEVLRHIKEKYPSIPIVITAAQGAEEKFRVGTRDYLKKHYALHDVAERIKGLADVSAHAQMHRHLSLPFKNQDAEDCLDMSPHITRGILRAKKCDSQELRLQRLSG